MTASVAVVVVNWNGLADTRACVQSLQRLTTLPSDIAVIDNGSTDGSADALRRDFPSVSVIEAGGNLGYAGAANIGIDHARARGFDYVWLLNNDTTVDEAALGELLAFVRRRGADAILTPQILDASGRLWSAGGALRWPWLERAHVGTGDDPREHSAPRRVAWGSGCSLFFPTRVVDRIGPLDERYFLYLEDVDWCLRARRAGIAVCYVASARISHGVSRSVGSADPRLLRYYGCRNYYMLVWRHGGAAGRAWAAGRYAITVAKIGARLLVSPAHRHDALYAAQTRALLDVALRRGGPAPYAHERLRDARPAPAGVPG